MKILITGGAGFIAHHVIRHFLKNTDFIPEMVYWTEGGELRKNLDSKILEVKYLVNFIIQNGKLLL